MIGTNLDIFDIEVTPVPLTKFLVNWPLDSGEAAQNDFVFVFSSDSHLVHRRGTILAILVESPRQYFYEV